MQRVSTNLTLFYKIFLPTFWFVFFGIFTLAVFFAGMSYYGYIPAGVMKIILLTFLVPGGALLYWKFMRLKRVEMDENYLYVSNYFKTFRYSFQSVEKLEKVKSFLNNYIRIHLKESGHFGKEILFIPSKKLFAQFLEEHPDVQKQLTLTGF